MDCCLLRYDRIVLQDVDLNYYFVGLERNDTFVMEEHDIYHLQTLFVAVAVAVAVAVVVAVAVAVVVVVAVAVVAAVVFEGVKVCRHGLHTVMLFSWLLFFLHCVLDIHWNRR